MSKLVSGGLHHWFAQPDATVGVLTLGILLLYVEANRPGLVVPGCAGLFLVILSLASGRAVTHARLSVVIPCGGILALATVSLLRIASVARRNKFVLGAAGLLHKRGTTRTPLTPGGRIEIAGELWPAEGIEPIAAGRPVVVVAAIRAGTLQVRELAR